MMTLGVTWADAPVPQTCEAVCAGALSLVAAQQDDARERLALQLACHRMNSAFLPLSARCGIRTDKAQEWLAAQKSTLSTALERVEGQTQLTLHFGALPSPTPPARTGTDWLYARARVAGRKQALIGLVEAQAARRATKDRRLQTHATGLALHLLVPIQDICAEATHWHTALVDRIKPHWHMTCSGGWPPTAFGLEVAT